MSDLCAKKLPIQLNPALIKAISGDFTDSVLPSVPDMDAPWIGLLGYAPPLVPGPGINQPGAAS